MTKKVRGIMLPEVKLHDATLQEAVGFVARQAREADPAKQGINIVVKGATQARITMNLTNVSLFDALQNIARLAGMSLQIEPRAVALAPARGNPSPAPKGAPRPSIPGAGTSSEIEFGSSLKRVGR